MMTDAPRLNLPPTKQGSVGKAWRMDIEAMRAHYGGSGAEVCLWIVEAPWAHPMWHSYMIGAVHLRPVEALGAAKIFLPGATHEVMVYALNPEHAVRLDRCPAFLTPANFHGQWIAESDDAAAAKVEACVDDIIAGRLSPDTDFRSDWTARFSASNMKGPDIPPGLVVLAGDTAVIVGTGKANAEAITQAAAGPIPPKSEMN